MHSFGGRSPTICINRSTQHLDVHQFGLGHDELENHVHRQICRVHSWRQVDVVCVLSNATESNSNAKQRVKDVKTLSSILLLAVVGLGEFAE